MAYSNLLVDNDLTDNPTARVPICLCLDTSGSMTGEPINELNAGVSMFYNAIREDEMALYSAEIAIVTFGDGGVQCIADFAGLATRNTPPVLEASGMTPMGEAMNMALDRLDARKEAYKKVGVDYYQPWLVLMTDGAPNGSDSELARAESRTQSLVSEKKLTIFPIGIGREADMKVLQQFSPNRPPLRLKDLKFREFFQWLSQSVSRVSQSIPGERVPLDQNGIKGWAEL